MKPKTAVVLLADGFEEVEAVTPVDALRRAGVDVKIASLAGDGATGARGIVVKADLAAGAVDFVPDLLVLPGGMPGAANLGSSPAAKALAEKVLRAGGILAAICAAPVMTLGAWGMLDGRKATCYTGMEKSFPPGVAYSPERVVVDGNIVTSRGPGTALEFSLALVEKMLGGEKSAALAETMIARVR